MEEFSEKHLMKNNYYESAVMVNAAGASDCAQGDGTYVLDQKLISNCVTADNKTWYGNRVS